jgi:hypothetical protein
MSGGYPAAESIATRLPQARRLRAIPAQRIFLPPFLVFQFRTTQSAGIDISDKSV